MPKKRPEIRMNALTIQVICSQLEPDAEELRSPEDQGMRKSQRANMHEVTCLESGHVPGEGGERREAESLQNDAEDPNST